MISVFIDGREGTTGLRIWQRLEGDPGVKIIRADPRLRKNENERRRRMNEADCVFLCLPDAAAREAVTLVENPNTVIIDASTAHRTEPGWAYGFPELSPAHERIIRISKRITVPGCHASGFCALIYPLVHHGAIRQDARLTCVSLTGYSGGGKPMIAEYEGEKPPRGARPYSLSLDHKHLPEMKTICGLTTPPLFQPILAPVRQGILLSVPLFMDARHIYNILSQHYAYGGNVKVMPFGVMPESGRMEMEALNGTDRMELYVFGNRDKALLYAKFDNLGKGASGAAVQCMNLKFRKNH